jgi:hypothetical protein
MRSNSFQLFPYMAIARRLVTTGKGRELTELSFWVWGPGNVTLCRAVLEFGLLAGLKSSLSFPLGKARVGTGTKYGYRLGILYLVWISVLSAHRTVSLASVLGHNDDAVWELGNGGGCLLPVTWVCFFVSVLCINSCWVMVYLSCWRDLVMYTKYGRNNFMITVKALVVVLEIVSRFIHSLSFVIICALWFINILSGIWIYCIGNDRYANCSPRESMVRGLADQRVDGKIRVRAQGFLSRAFPLLARPWGLTYINTEMLGTELTL